MLVAVSNERLAPGMASQGGGRNGPVYVKYPYFTPAPGETRPHAYLADVKEPFGVIQPHFHTVDQFQVFVRGTGVVGKDPAAPILVQFTDRYTPYGPYKSGADGIAFFTLRPQHDPGAQYMPESRRKLLQKAGRNLTWSKRIDTVDTIRISEREAQVETVFAEESDGLGAWLTRTAPGGRVPLCGGPARAAQYWLVANGAVVTAGRTLPVWSCLWVDAQEPQPELTASSAGADVLILQFPRTPPGVVTADPPKRARPARGAKRPGR